MLPVAPFGRTGHHSSRVIFGAAALAAMSQERADRTLQIALDAGINHIDTAAMYGASEDRLRPFLARHRGEVFLATKTYERSGDGARRQLEQSLQRMGVDHVDMVQLHNLVEPDEFEVAHAPGGAVEALARAVDEGLVRFVGVTGHGLRIPAMHVRSLERFPFSSVLCPYSFTLASDPQYAADFERLVEVCTDRGVAIQTIKSVARRRWQPDDPSPHFAWYEPLPAGDALQRAVRFVLSRPELFLNSSSDARLLPAIIEAALEATASPGRPSDAEMLADAAAFGITPLFDGGVLDRI